MNRAFTCPYPVSRRKLGMDMNFPHGRLAPQDRKTGKRKAVNLDVLLAGLSLQHVALQAKHARGGAGESTSPMFARMHYFAGPVIANKAPHGRRALAPKGSFSPSHANNLQDMLKQMPIHADYDESVLNHDSLAIVKNVKLHPLLRKGIDAASAHRGQI